MLSPVVVATLPGGRYRIERISESGAVLSYDATTPRQVARIIEELLSGFVPRLHAPLDHLCLPAATAADLPAPVGAFLPSLT
jgi:hypothetical protein